jgi:hypothetical protein
LGNNELRRKEIVESQSEKKNSSNLQDRSSMNEDQKLRKWVGVGYAGRVAKAALVGIATLTAKVSADTPAGTALVNPDTGKATALHPYSEGAQSWPQSEFNLDHVTPETLEHFSKFMKNPKRFIQEMQQREQKQQMRRLAEKARENPEVLEDLRKLFEEVPGKVKNRKIDIGTERLTPEKINPEVWESVRRMLTERRELNDNTGTTVVLVHGFVGNGPFIGDPVNCHGGYRGDAVSYLQARGYSDIRTVQYYASDSNCDVDLHAQAYQNLCDGFNPGSEGTNNEDLNHVSCLLVQYLNQNFAGGQKVILVGHSM